MNLADDKRAEALAHEIAEALQLAPQSAGRVRVYRDDVADTWAVRVRIARLRYELTMPAPGALYGLWRNGTWLGGMNTGTDAEPVDVATAMLHRIAVTL